MIKPNQLAPIARALEAVTVAPDTSGSTGVMFTKLVGSVVELFYKDNLGREIQFSSDGQVAGGGGGGGGGYSSGLNLGTAGSGKAEVYASTNLDKLFFKRLRSGLGIDIVQDDDYITFAANGGGSTAPIGKMLYNNTGTSIPAGSVLAFANDGSVELADANVASLSDIAGVCPNTIGLDAYGMVVRVGNVPGVLAGFSAPPGARVYLSEIPGQLSLTAPMPQPGTAIIIVGTAEPASNTQTPCDDLFVCPDIVTGG